MAERGQRYWINDTIYSETETFNIQSTSFMPSFYVHDAIIERLGYWYICMYLLCVDSPRSFKPLYLILITDTLWMASRILLVIFFFFFSSFLFFSFSVFHFSCHYILTQSVDQTVAFLSVIWLFGVWNICVPHTIYNVNCIDNNYNNNNCMCFIAENSLTWALNTHTHTYTST